MIQTTRGGAQLINIINKKLDTYKGSWVTEFICSKKQLTATPVTILPGAPI